MEVTFSAPDPGTVRGVLVYHRPSDRRRKTVKWRSEDDLQEVFYFELDETERGESWRRFSGFFFTLNNDLECEMCVVKMTH